MTKDCNIFQDKTQMTSGTVKTDDDDNAPVRTAQYSKPGQGLPGEVRSPYMGVQNITRPRRGHDY